MADKDWWRSAVTYQIYPRSFKDSNGDGVGDLAGITDKLDYVASLGVDAIWISPFFKSPMKDFGYDVSDYTSVDPIFGRDEDFDILLKRAHELNLKIIIDMVMSHTSNQHAWFIESRSSRDNARADWYVWADPQPDGSPPNNWQSCFAGAAWTYDTRREQYYLHNFLTEQPDLNFHNPAVQDAVLEECRFWLERGIDGFRLDVVNFYFHDQSLRNNPPRDPNAISTGVQYEKQYPYAMQQHIFDKSQPEMFDFLKRFRALCDEYESIMSIGEVGDDDPFKLSVEYTASNDMLHTCYNTHMMAGMSKSLTADLIRMPVEMYQSFGKGWPSWAFCNHDVVRPITRWGKDVAPESQQDFAKLLIAMVSTLRGSPYIYQGEELGLPEAIIPFDKIQDPWGKALWPEWQGRDGCRTPMPWTATNHHAGFSTTSGETWLPLPDTHIHLAADKQDIDPASSLNFTRAFLKWRREQPALSLGDMAFVETGDDKLLAFHRTLEGERVLCVYNLGSEPKTLKNISAEDVLPSALIASRGNQSGGTLTLPGFGIFIGKE